MQRITLLICFSFFADANAIVNRIRADNRDEMITGVAKLDYSWYSIGRAALQWKSGLNVTLRTAASFTDDPGFIGDDREYKSIRTLDFSIATDPRVRILSKSPLVCCSPITDDDNVSDVLVLHRMGRPVT